MHRSAQNDNAGAPVQFPRGLNQPASTPIRTARSVGDVTLEGRSPLKLEFRELTYRVKVNKTQKTILNSVSGSFAPGHLVALMGPSGAGKSTLINILAGFITNNIEGRIFVNGRPRSLGKFRKNSCYIMQEDLLLPHLTVLEAMTFSANLRLCDPAKRKKAMVQSVLKELSLVECSTTRSSALSGGQKKRLAIAQELLSNPPVMFFDEPTSGLDSSNSFQCVSLLKELAQGGRTIVCSIHQPSAKLFEMFDELYFVVRGRCLYDGPVAAVVPYLASRRLICPSYHNPIDFLMELVSEDCSAPTGNSRVSVVEQLSDAVQKGDCVEFMRAFQPSTVNNSSSNTGIIRAAKSFATLSGSLHSIDTITDDDASSVAYSTGIWNQFRVLLIRTFLSIVRDTLLTQLRVISHIFVGILVGLIYYKIGNDGSETQSNVGFLFFCMMFLIFTSMMPTIMTFPMEMKIFLREHLNNWYGVSAYFLAKTLADLPFQVVFPLIYCAISYFMTEQPADAARFALYSTVCVLTCLVAQSMGLVIGASTTVESAVFLGPVASIPVLLFSGFFVTFSAMPVYLRWLSYISYIRYAFEGTLQTIYGNSRAPLICPATDQFNASIGLQNRTPTTTVSFCNPDPVSVLSKFKMESADVAIDCVALCSIFVVLRCMCLIILAVRAKRRR